MRSLKHKIMVPVFLLTSIAIILLCYLTYNQAKAIIVEYTELIVEEKVEKLSSFVDHELNEGIHQMELLASIDEAKSMDYEKFFLKVSKLENVFKKYEVVFMSDKKGNFTASNGVKGNITDRKYFYNVLDGETVISEPITSKSTGNPIILIASPIRDDHGNIIGLVGATINLYEITEVINEEKLGESGYAYMISSKGKTIAHPRTEFLLKTTLEHGDSESFRAIINKMADGGDGHGYYEFEGIKKIIFYKPIESKNWTIGMTANYDEISKGIFILRNSILVLGLVLVTIILVVLRPLTDMLVDPINKLKEYMEIASKGDFTVSSDISTDDEIGVLSDSFNTLIKENKRLLDETVKYDKLKTEFFSNISHELKTPLNIIFSSTQLLNLCITDVDGELSVNKLEKYISMIKQNSYRLLRLVNNLIDITKIDSGFMKLNLKTANIIEVVENITLSTAEYVKSKGRTLIFDTDVEEQIMAFDPEKMERIMLNLISNAVKFTMPGDRIEVRISSLNNNIQISVKDTGIGISEDKQKIIFDKFTQVNNLYSRRNEGSGIGLSLVKSLVDMQRGRVLVKSKLGKGTEFIIELPINVIYDEEGSDFTEEFTKQTNVEKIQIEFSDIYE